MIKYLLVSRLGRVTKCWLNQLPCILCLASIRKRGGVHITYAIIESCGRQYKVAEGDVVFFEKLDVEEGKKVTFDKVVLVSEDKKVEVGAPYVKGVKVEGKVVANGKGKKILVYKYKAKKNYRRTQGHRQPYTKVEITKIKTAAEKEAKAVDGKTAEVKAEKATTAKKETAKK